MRNSNKLIGAVVLSTAIVSSGVAVMANNEKITEKNDSDLTSILIKKLDNGEAFDLKLINPSEMTGYTLTLDIYGSVELEDSCFKIAHEDEKTIVKSAVKKNGDTTRIIIAVTSDSSLIKKNTNKSNSVRTFDIGKIYIKNAKEGSKYNITKVEFNSISSADDSMLKTSSIDDDSDKEIIITKDVTENSGGSQNIPTFPSHSEDKKPGGGTSENENKPEKPNPDPEGGGAGGGESGGGSEGETEKPEEKPPVKPEEPEKPGDNDNTGGSTGGGTSKPEKPEEEKPTEHNVQLFSMSGADRYETSTKISKTGWTSGAKNVVIVNGNEKNIVDGLSATPFASIKNAPVLLSNNGKLPSSTISELKRLNPTNVYVIGGTTSMPESVVKSIKNNTKATVTRIGGKSRYETSLAIAKQIDKIADVNKVYISSGTGEVDALSIASVAGRDKAPILLTNVNKVDVNTYNFIKSENVKNAYFIGGEKKISNSVIKQIDKVVSADVSKNRVAGQNRKDTNAEVIEKFYTSSKLNGVVVAKDDVIVDALTVGSFAAKNDMPVVIAKNSLSSAQKSALTGKKTEKVYQSGGGVKASVIDNLKELLGTKK